ncbi:MAG: AbrB/MazE/SpoVT family DNA-binding domain-containing protein [Nitrospinota bacterium]
MIKIKVTTVGNSTGIIIPREALARLKVEKGDSLCLTETPDGYELSPYDPTFEEEMAVAGKVSKRYRNALRKLAK